MTRLVLAAAVLALGVAGRPTPAGAHQASFTYAALTTGEGGRSLVYELKIRSTDLFEALGGTSGEDASAGEIAAGEGRLYDYVTDRVSLEAPGQACATERRPVEVVEQNERFAVLRLVLVCPEPIVTGALDYRLFFDLDPGHIGLVTVDGEVVQLRSPGHERLEWRVGAAFSGLGGFVVSGIEHIVFGLDHILFLISLLLVAVVRRDGGGLTRRPLGPALRYTAGIVTAFTVAHSLTLIAAALGWVSLPGRLVESVIAASIVYVAIENLVRPDPPRRYLVTFGFGLVHGLGFASMLAPLLPPEGVVLPLLAFNVGVELGQLALVAVCLPILLGLVRVMGAARYRRHALAVGAAALGSLGLIWLVERAFEVTILGL
jgi:hypothetical protein